MSKAQGRFAWASAAVASVTIALGSAPTDAASIRIGSGSAFMWLENRGINDVGSASGLRLQYGANVLGGSLGTSISGFYAPLNLTDPAVACAPLATNANFCSNARAYSSSNPQIAEPWTITFTRPGESPVSVPAPSMTGATPLVPFPSQVRVSGAGTTPTISWELPNGYVPDGFRIQVFDKTRIRVNGSADIIHVAAVAANTTSYTIPTTLSTGLSLANNGNYSINFQIIETRGHVPFTGPNPQILSRSNSFFSFSPLDSSAPPNVFLPQVGQDPNPNDDRGAPYQFEIENVGPSSVTFIDPFVAVGYDYATGAGDPNFASVLLPQVGDGEFTVVYVGPNGETVISLTAGDQFFFPAGGVSAFSVRGIEESAALNPDDPTAFVTGLSFVATGNFTGTMIPLVVFAVPEPETYALMLVGLGVVAYASRRRKKA